MRAHAPRTGTTQLQWGLGENPGRNIRRSIQVASFSPTGRLQWGLGENPGRNLHPGRVLLAHRAASMGPGRKPRKEPTASSRRSRATPGFNGAWAKTQEGTPSSVSVRCICRQLQWGLGENPGRNARREGLSEAAVHGFNGAWAKTQEGTYHSRMGGAPPRFASMGPGRKPRKERRVRRGGFRASKLQWGLGENPGRNVERGPVRLRGFSIASMGPGRKPRKEPGIGVWSRNAAWLQWGLGENPGRNGCLRQDALDRARASMGPGRKPRKELSISGITAPPSRFNGAWAKTQEGTPPRSANGAETSSCFNGAWAKTQEGTHGYNSHVVFRAMASMGPGRKPRKERWRRSRVP